MIAIGSIIKIIFLCIILMYIYLLNHNNIHENFNIENFVKNHNKLKEIQDLSLQEKIGQLMCIGFKTPVLTEEIRAMIREYKIGNFILFSRNIRNLTQFEKLNRDIHEEVMKTTGIMPFIGIDQEGGNIIRIKEKSTSYPGPMTLSATTIENAKMVGHMMGRDLMALGVNMNFAPLLDINNNPKNPIIGIRSFSDKPEIVSKYAIELIKGMQEEGIIATAKHYPGHGDVEIDSHLDLPIFTFDKERLYNMELKPYKEAIDKGLKSIMTAHILFKEIDNENPATLSKILLKGILRDELNYKGLIYSDCMEMDAISKRMPISQAAVKGIKAGNDIILVCHTKEHQIESIKKIKKAIEDNLITLEEIDDRVSRILKYKNEVYSIMKEKFFLNKNNLDIFINSNQDKIIQKIVDSSLTFVNGKQFEMKGKILIYWCKISALDKAQFNFNKGKNEKIINKEIASIDLLEYNPKEYSQNLIDKSENYDTIIFLSFNAFYNSSQAKMINKLNSINSNFFVISIRNPYDYLAIDKNINFYTLYESTPNSMRTLNKFLKGEIDAVGKLPIDLKHI